MKLYVAMPFTDDTGDHEVGEEIEFPRETDEQKAGVDTLIRYGVLSKTKAGAKPEKAE